MTKKKIISLMAVVMVIQLLVPFGVVAKKNKGYKEVEQYGTTYLMRASYFELSEDCLNFDFENSNYIFNRESEDDDFVYITLRPVQDYYYFESKTQEKKNNNYLDKNVQMYYNIPIDEVSYMPTEVGNTSFSEMLRQRKYNLYDIRIQIKVYRGKAVITGVFYQGEKVIELDNYRMT